MNDLDMPPHPDLPVDVKRRMLLSQHSRTIDYATRTVVLVVPVLHYKVVETTETRLVPVLGEPQPAPQEPIIVVNEDGSTTEYPRAQPDTVTYEQQQVVTRREEPFALIGKGGNGIRRFRLMADDRRTVDIRTGLYATYTGENNEYIKPEFTYLDDLLKQGITEAGLVEAIMLRNIERKNFDGNTYEILD
ncbi:hypothetical protein GCM10023189_43160 [Nibrella saemangeumensis]|uniref:Uncharacterized protein n=1 Tax=Nibrella saemangeumensis TaxID=1084526 RepID=A0ABP8NAQ7_9BACT